jgi:hypothetical protein
VFVSVLKQGCLYRFRDVTILHVLHG